MRARAVAFTGALAFVAVTLVLLGSPDGFIVMLFIATMWFHGRLRQLETAAAMPGEHDAAFFGAMLGILLWAAVDALVP